MSSSQRPKRALLSYIHENKQEDLSKKRKEDCPIAEEVLATNAQGSNEKTLRQTHEDFEFEDDSLNRECLTRCLTCLCDNLTAEEIVVHLKTNKILTEPQVDSIRAKETRYEKIQKLVDFVQKRGPDAFSCFMKSLTETGQKYIFDKLCEERKLIAEEKILRFPTSSNVYSSDNNLLSIQRSLQELYSQSYLNVVPFSLPFFFDVEDKWVNLTLKFQGDLTVTEDYADVLKKAYAKAKMLIIEGDPGVGKSSHMHRLAYEWTQSRLSDYDLVLHIEFRKLREYKFKDIRELITHYMKGYLDEEEYKKFHHFISDTKCCKEHKILVLLDGYDESSLEEQCQELSDYFNSPIGRPLLFNVLITSRKGYLSKLRNQGRYIFADITGFTTESQRLEYISKHFNTANDTDSLDNTAAVTTLLKTNTNLKRLSESPLMLTFICLLHKNIIDGTEVELYMNIIWWMIDRYQKRAPNLDVPSLFDFEHHASDKCRIIENNYQHFPQLHLLGKMAMQDVFKTTFTENDLEKFQVKEIVQQVGFLRKEEKRDASYHTKTEFSFVHRTVQEFIMALTFFYSNEEPTEHFCWYIFHSGRYIGYGIKQEKIRTFLNMISAHKMNISKSRKNKYTQLLKQTEPMMLRKSQILQQNCTNTMVSQNYISHSNRTNAKNTPQSQEEALKLVQDAANEGDNEQQYILGLLYDIGIIIIQSDEEAFKWYRKSAKQGNANAQNNLGFMYESGKGISQSNRKAVKWYTKSAKQGNTFGQSNLGNMYKKGTGVSQSDEEAVKWYKKSAEQGDADAQFKLGFMYEMGKDIPQSDKVAVKWYRKSAEQGNAFGQNQLGFMYENGKGVPQSNEEAVKWYTQSAEQGNAFGQNQIGFMYEHGKGVPQSAEEALKWYTKAAEQGDAYAQYTLGFMYEKEKGRPQSDEEAVKWYTKSAKQGFTISQNKLGFMYATGKGVPQSDGEAVKWFKISADRGNADAQFNLGFIYENGKGLPQSNEEAVKWYTKSAQQGNADAQFNLGWMYQNGRGVPQSDGEAVKRYTISAEQGCTMGANTFGFQYADVKVLSKLDEEAVKWHTKSAEQGFAVCQKNLQPVFTDGKGMSQSNEEAIKWFRISTEQVHTNEQNNVGNRLKKEQGVHESDKEDTKRNRQAEDQGFANDQKKSRNMNEKRHSLSLSDQKSVKGNTRPTEQRNRGPQFYLENMSETGRGLPLSEEEAVKWHSQPEDQGNANAQHNLAVIYGNGKGLPQSYKEIVNRFRKSEDQGNVAKQHSIENTYETGQGLPQSDEEAMKLSRKAAEQGDGGRQNYFGLMYMSGQAEEDVKWYRIFIVQIDAFSPTEFSDAIICKRIWMSCITIFYVGALMLMLRFCHDSEISIFGSLLVIPALVGPILYFSLPATIFFFPVLFFNDCSPIPWQFICLFDACEIMLRFFAVYLGKYFRLHKIKYNSFFARFLLRFSCIAAINAAFENESNSIGMGFTVVYMYMFIFCDIIPPTRSPL